MCWKLFTSLSSRCAVGRSSTLSRCLVFQRCPLSVVSLLASLFGVAELMKVRMKVGVFSKTRGQTEQCIMATVAFKHIGSHCISTAFSVCPYNIILRYWTRRYLFFNTNWGHKESINNAANLTNRMKYKGQHSIAPVPVPKKSKLK